MAKKILLFIAQHNFRDEEYFHPKEVFVREGAEVKTMSFQPGKCFGSEGGQAEADYGLEDKMEERLFDALVFVGGSGMADYLNDPRLTGLARDFYYAGHNKVLAAICISPAILANAGLLNGKKATSWSGVREILEKKGAFFQEKDVVVDGNIITANGPLAASHFGEEIIRRLAEL